MPVGRPRSGVDLKRQIEGNADFLVEHAAEQKRGPRGAGASEALKAKHPGVFNTGRTPSPAHLRGLNLGGANQISVAEAQLKSNLPPRRKRRRKVTARRI